MCTWPCDALDVRFGLSVSKDPPTTHCLFDMVGPMNPQRQACVCMYTCACPLQPPPICAAAGRTLHCQYLPVRQCALPTRQRPRPSRQCRNRTGRSSLPPVHCLSTAHENQWPAGSGGKCSMLLVVSAYCSMRGGCQCTKMFKTVKSAWQHIHKQLTPHYNYRCWLASAWGRAPSGGLPVKKGVYTRTMNVNI